MGATPPCGVLASHHGGFSCFGAQTLGICVSVATAREISSCDTYTLGDPVACGIFPDQEWNTCTGRQILTTAPPEKFIPFFEPTNASCRLSEKVKGVQKKQEKKIVQKSRKIMGEMYPRAPSWQGLHTSH